MELSLKNVYIADFEPLSYSVPLTQCIILATDNYNVNECVGIQLLVHMLASTVLFVFTILTAVPSQMNLIVEYIA